MYQATTGDGKADRMRFWIWNPESELYVPSESWSTTRFCCSQVGETSTCTERTFVKPTWLKRPYVSCYAIKPPKASEKAVFFVQVISAGWD